jgi:4-hydroxybenzoate polyprenyltransferase
MTVMEMSGERLRERLDLYERLMRLDKPIGILLLLWPTLWALWLSALGRPDWLVVGIFVLGTVLMRSAGCVINDLADRSFDPHVARTRNRPLAAGRVSVREALLLFAALVVCAVLVVLPLRSWLLGGLCVAALFLAVSYPFTKRFLAVPQAYLGVAFGFGIPMAYAAQLGSVPAEAWWLLLANVFWAIAYDTEYAMVDRADDLKLGIRTSAITFGRAEVAAVMLCYALALGAGGHGRTRSRAWRLFLRRPGGCCRHCRLPLHADPRTRPSALLPGFPAQQLAWRQRLCRHRPRFSFQQRNFRMKTYLFCSLALLAGAAQAAEDVRQLAPMPAAAAANLGAEMRANLLALNEILSLVAAGKLKEAGELAEKELGIPAMGKHRGQPFDARPGPHMPPAMHAIGIDGHKAASEFARIAASGDRERTIAALPSLTTACVGCHYAYRIR